MNTEFKSTQLSTLRSVKENPRLETNKPNFRPIAGAGLTTQAKENLKKTVKSLPENNQLVNKRANGLQYRKPSSPPLSSGRSNSSTRYSHSAIPSEKPSSPPLPIGNRTSSRSNSPSALSSGNTCSPYSPTGKRPSSPGHTAFPIPLGKQNSSSTPTGIPPTLPLPFGKNSLSPIRPLSTLTSGKSSSPSSPTGKLTSSPSGSPSVLPSNKPSSPPTDLAKYPPTSSPYSLTSTSTAPKKPLTASPVKLAPPAKPEPDPNLKQFKLPSTKLAQRVALSKPAVVVSREEIQQLTSKFERLSVAIVELATSNCPVSVRSLESLLTKEVEDCLGPAVNCAKFAQLFVQESRLLLNTLNCEFEEGKVNNKLIKGHKATKQRFLRTNPDTTICYRDRYLKELVMNALQGMCSDQVEEEVSAVTRVRTQESKARISALRDLVRAEAGLDPEVFRRGQERLEELQKTLSRSHLEVLSATREIEEIISEQRLAHLEMRIPRSARNALMGPENIRRKASEGRVCNCDNEAMCVISCSDDPSSSECCENVSKNCAESFDVYEKKLDNAAAPEEKSDTCNGESVNSDYCDSSRLPDGSILSDEELKMKKVPTKEEIPLKDWPESSTESVMSERTLYDHSDDEIDEEETLMFLQALKADIEHNRRVDQAMGYRTCLEKVDEGCEGDFGQGIDKDCKLSFYDEAQCTRTAVTGGSNFNTTVDSVEMLGQLHENVYLTNKPSSVFSDTPSSFKDNLLSVSVKHVQSASDLDKTQDNVINSVKSHWWSPDDSIASEIVTEIKKAFHAFGEHGETDKDALPKFEVEGDKNTGNNINVPDNKVQNGDYNFSIEEVAIILMLISNKIQQLPETLEKHNSNGPDSYSHLTLGQQYKILQTIANFDCFLDDYSRNDDVNNFNDTGSFLTTAKKVSLTFSFLSNVLNHAPHQLRNQPISVLFPPESLITTLAVFASIEYFKDCFIWGVIEASKSKLFLTSFDEVLAKTSICYLKNYGQDYKTRNNVSTLSNKTLDIVKPGNLGEKMSSREIIRTESVEKRVQQAEMHSSLETRRASAKLAEKPGQIDKNMSSYEHFLGLSASVMTVQDLSNMFLFLSTVLNDVPHRIKSEKVVDLNPPPSLLAALSVLYLADDEDSLELENTISFSSLTVQDASDFFLTLAKAFENVPERLRNTTVKELDPPQSLLKAVSLLTSLSNNTVLEGASSEEEVNEEAAVDETTHKEESLERFYDALESVPP